MHLLPRKVYCLIAAALFMSGCSPSLPKDNIPASGTYRVPTEIRFQLSSRDFLLHVPQDFDGRLPLPLVVVLHGAFSTAAQTEKETGFSRLADEEKFLVAYPEGIGLFGYLQHWNAGHCCGKAVDDNIDDVAFIGEVINVVAKRLPVDEQRIYLAGMSNGGMLVHRFAAERGERIAAAAVVSGALGSSLNGETPWQVSAPGNPPSMLLIHGDSDRHVPSAGGASPLNGRETRSYLSLEDATRFWKNALGCDEAPLAESRNDGALQTWTWTGCSDGKQLEVIELKGWGHQWPGLYFTRQQQPSEALYNLDGTLLIWDFFQRHSLGQGNPR